MSSFHTHILSHSCVLVPKTLVTHEFMCVYVNVWVCRREMRKGEGGASGQDGGIGRHTVLSCTTKRRTTI